jgi:purine-nucleoside phosphorylase
VDLFDKIQEAASAIRAKTSIVPRVGVVLGSGLGAFAERVEGRVVVPYSAIPHFPQSGVQGHAGELVLGTLDGVPCAVMSGRVHYYEGHSLDTVTFGVRVFAAIGVQHLLITNAAGAVNPTFAPGDFMVIVDHINLTGSNPLRGPNDERLGPRFPDMSAAYGPAGRQALHGAARDVGITLREGVYAGLAGPSYETPAEIRMLQNIGADAVGMSTVAEVIVAAHAGLGVAGLSVVTNRAAGLGSTPLSHEEVKEVGNKVRGLLCDLLAGTVKRLA